MYEYKKTDDAVFKAWTPWSKWERVNCNTPKITCNANDINCLKENLRLDRKEKIGTYEKKYLTTSM